MDEGYTHIGQLLRDAREEQMITLDYASQQLHIRARYLQALELGKFSDLPGAAYAKGYLQAYAAFLQLDRMEVLRRFEQVDGVLARKGFFLPQVFRKEKNASNMIVGIALACAVAAYILWVYVLQPEKISISLVDTPSRWWSDDTPVTAAMAEDVACLQAHKRLYPPCHVMTDGQGELLPLSQTRTIMELAPTTDGEQSDDTPPQP